MTIKHLREWVNQIPECLEHLPVVCREASTIEGDDEILLTFLDIPISVAGLDEETKEAFLMSSESDDIINKYYNE